MPSGVATNFTVALSASVALESVTLRASRTAAASGTEAGTCSASDMAVQRRVAETDRRLAVEVEAERFSFRGTLLRSSGSRSKATFPKDVSREETDARSSHSAVVSHDRNHSSYEL